MYRRSAPPETATSLAEFVRYEAGEQLDAILVAFGTLADARGGAVDSVRKAYAQAVQTFLEHARRRLLSAEFLVWGRRQGIGKNIFKFPPPYGSC